MNPHFLSIFLAFSLLISWFLFFRFYRRSRLKQSASLRRIEDARKHIQEQNSGLENFTAILSEVHELARQTPEPETRAELARVVVESACRVLKCVEGSLMLVDQETHELVTAAVKGAPDESFKVLRLKLGEGIAGRVAESGKAIITDDVATDARFLNDQNLEHHRKALVALPLKIKDRVVGVLSVHGDETHPSFSDRETRTLEMLADHAALAFENLDLYIHLHHFYLDMVETLAKALDLKEFQLKTFPTIDRNKNRQYARAIAEELNLPESIIKYIEFASLIYGVGKIGIDEAILRKPGKLSMEEYEKIKKHPEIGQEIISQVKFLSPIASMIHYHQERWDGKGYPAGLKGEEIPLGARIVSVINVYCAMISERPYRAAMSQEEAMAELKRGAGTQFDPKVVEAFVRILERRKENSGEKPRKHSGPFDQEPAFQRRVENL